MKLIPLTERTFCIDSSTMSVLYYTDDGGAVLLEPGHLRDFDELSALLRETGRPLRGILTTHSHHDHFGNCRALAKEYGLPVILPMGEATACRSIESLASSLGFYSTRRIRNSEEVVCTVGPIDVPLGFHQDHILIAGERFDIIHAPGHSPDIVCYRTPDGVLVVGDVLLSDDSIAKMRMPYTTSIGMDLRSKALIGKTPCSWCVMAHRGYVRGEDLPGLAERNINHLNGVIGTVRSLITHTMSIDELIPLVCIALHIRGMNPLHGMHVRHTLSAILGYLIDEGAVIPKTMGGLTHYIPAELSEEPIIEIVFDGSESGSPAIHE